MTIANYINDLLYRYDCVIVPNFGGFVTNKTSAYIDENAMYPPTKKISFNSHLQHNDGLLANYMVAKEGISFDEATQKIQAEVVRWKNELEKNPLTIASVGALELNEENQLVFEPNTNTNFLTSSFGLAEVPTSVIERLKEESKPIIPLHEEVVESTEERKRGIPQFIRYAASVAILLTLGMVLVNNYKTSENSQILANEQHKIEQKIQEATFVIENPLPTINLKGSKVSKKDYPYHIIAGAFEIEENAQKKVQQLQRKGFNPQVLGKNKWGLTQVTYNSFTSENEARTALAEIKQNHSQEAWLLIKN